MKLLALILSSGLMLALLALAPDTNAQTANFSVVHQFNGASEGIDPSGELVQGPDGNFYGTAFGGGSANFGTVFRLTPAGDLTVLHTFTGPDGSNPDAGLYLDADGNFYGTTYAGGSANLGTVFRLTPAGVFTTLYSFTGTNGQKPVSGVVRGPDGNFYGTTPGGGGQEYGGTVYQLTPGGTITTLHNFAYQDSSNPTAPLVRGTDGKLYGTTFGDGTNRRGTVYSITTGGEFTVLHNFTTLGYEGVNPHGGLFLGSDGNFYGTTIQGGVNETGDPSGTVFRMTPNGVVTRLHTFSSDDGTHGLGNGPDPEGALLQTSDGTLYGTLRFGGPDGNGRVFALSLSGVYTLLHDFSAPDATGVNADGAISSPGLVQGSDGSLYGVTARGGTGSAGTVYKLTVTPGFFEGEVVLDVGNEVYYLRLPNGNPFGYYSYLDEANYIYHFDLGYEYVFNAMDNRAGVYLYDFASNGFFYTSPTFPFPYLYDFSLNSTVYYYPDPDQADHPGRYNTNGVRYFYVFSTGQIISK